MGGYGGRNRRAEGRFCGHQPSPKEPRHGARHFRHWAQCLDMEEQRGQKMDLEPPAVERKGCCAELDEAMVECAGAEVHKEQSGDSGARNGTA